ncbi:AMP-dependent synthetase/ligase [Baekduia soli]|nr:long-chain fatty acid--CoA ligase [Baekduia soli]
MSAARTTTASSTARDADADVATVGAMVLSATARHHGAALRRRTADGWSDVSFAELGETARGIARGLIALGVRPGDPVAILSSTRAEWTMADCGGHCAGATVVPIYPTNSAEECRYVLEHSGAHVLLCEDATQLAKIAEVRDRLPELEHVVTFDDAGELSLAGLRELGADVDPGAVEAAVAAVGPDDVATIVYTSGTTGPPKGCRTTHRNCIATVRMYEEQIDFGDDVVIFMFLPLAHSLARMAQLVALDIGATLAFWRGDARLVLEDVADSRPTHLPSVPRVFEKIHAKALAAAQDGDPVRRLLFGWAVGTGREVARRRRTGRSLGLILAAQHKVADRLVLSRVRDLFGGRLQLALTGAAPIAVEVLEFFDACGLRVLEGYGMTETTAAGTLNTIGATRFGTVGRPLPGTEVTLLEDGEILMKGPHVFAGYHRDEAATGEVFTDDGRLRSGDLGEIDADGFVRVTGRKKDLIITSSGKNISPTNLESALCEGRWISQAVVFGDNRPYVVAMLTLDPDEVAALAHRAGVAPDLATMAADRRVHEIVAAEVDAVNAQFARIEQIKRFVILDHELTQAAGELTPTLKVRRNVIYERYADVFAGLYDEG